jgi:hypothetical protein
MPEGQNFSCCMSMVMLSKPCAAVISAVKGLPMLHQPFTAGLPPSQSCFSRFGNMRPSPFVNLSSAGLSRRPAQGNRSTCPEMKEPDAVFVRNDA